MIMQVYADNAATMRMREPAYEAMLPYIRDRYANASAINYESGRDNFNAVEAARSEIAECIGSKNASEIYFTSGATESNNLAVMGMASADSLNHGGNRNIIISTKIEHDSILKPLDHCKRLGLCNVRLVHPGEDGIVSVESIKTEIGRLLNEEQEQNNANCKHIKLLVSVMFANNEIGTMQPIREISEFCRTYKNVIDGNSEKNSLSVVFHTDATQAVGHVPINIADCSGIDLLSFSGHKFGGAKGVGVLYMRNGVNIAPIALGGGQERGMRSGTLNVAGIVATAAALKEATQNMRVENAKVLKLRNKLLSGLLSIPDSYVNGDVEKRLPNNLNMRFDGVEGEALVQMLSMYGIMVSTGSACSSGNTISNRVLKAIGLTEQQARESIRISISHENTEDEINYMIMKIKFCVNQLRRTKKVG